MTSNVTGRPSPRGLFQIRAMLSGMLLAAGAISANLPLVQADEPSEPRLREGWKWMVRIPEVNREETVRLFTNGNRLLEEIKYRHIVPESRILLWVEKGWLNVRRSTWDDELEWQVALSRASDPARPVIKIDERMSSLDLSYRGYFIRENGSGKLRIYREAKSADAPEWPTLTFAPWEFQLSRTSGRFADAFQFDYWNWVQAGPSVQKPDLWVRFSEMGGLRTDGGIGVQVTNYGGVLDELSDHRAQAHVEADLVVATRQTTAAAEQGLTGKPLQSRLKAERAPELAAGEWLNADKPLALGDLNGQYALIGFWGAWNEPSVKKLKEMNKLHERFGKRGLKVIGVHSAHKPEKAKEVVGSSEITFPVMIDSPPESPNGIVPGETARRYHVDALPAFFLIDSEGAVSTGYGMGPPAAELIDELLGTPEGKDKKTKSQ